ncbi:hypothetical protein ABB37_02019 [Leptomonas pyrrhocoris]|uniref:Uncharacterized protein n=1 Tax=Leptomonas pyrrhocoris TaxID=157538 RepID=A0A0N0VGJ8_LEPPY|nr:hypothetical protein ABB37_02019 [Leptomonas pyrrhocoris]KPA83804.1 hypothetical protein ABB37_02019 [Leptomonas pyrrhocoris]|eukprot:XP_015662243.1 hypothetical protein ABB37_02019 [Leptomonas pyrrhocoris]
MSSSASRAWQRRPSVAVFFVVVVLTLGLCCSAVASVAALPEGPRMSPIVQCDADFREICDDAQSARGLWGCMMKNVDLITNDVCREYVRGFRACTRDAEKKGSCVYPAADYATSVRRCLRSTPESSISEECLNSRFYFPIAEVRNAKW